MRFDKPKRWRVVVSDNKTGNIIREVCQAATEGEAKTAGLSVELDDDDESVLLLPLFELPN